MVLADDNFATIVEVRAGSRSIIPSFLPPPSPVITHLHTSPQAVREGRRVWDNLRKLLIFNLPVNFAQGFTIFWAYVVGFQDAPLTAIQVRRLGCFEFYSNSLAVSRSKLKTLS